MILRASLTNCMKRIEKDTSRKNIGAIGRHTGHHKLVSIRVGDEGGIWGSGLADSVCASGYGLKTLRYHVVVASTIFLCSHYFQSTSTILIDFIGSVYIY